RYLLAALDGYTEDEALPVSEMPELERYVLPAGLDLDGAPGLSREVQEKIREVRPATLGQASRIPGMTPAALALLRVHARRDTAVSI
ncbi:MAG: tRNA uridine-5-carboxymethylaminomethyl(34) synthesis enzyme MnmG, partial [Myxococcota bacterium]